MAKKLYKSVLFAIVFLSSESGGGAPFVINSAGVRIDGISIQSSADGTVTLVTQGKQTLTFYAGAYQQAVADQPDELPQAVSFVQSGHLSEAAELLCRVKEQYRFLGWGPYAGRMIARVKLAQKRFDDAVHEYDELFAMQPQLKEDPVDHVHYMQALLGAGRMDELSVLVNQDISAGSREAAARAQVLRGDMKTASGQIKEALLDYLRTTILFEDQKSVQPEATYKTAVSLKTLNDPRASAYFQKIINAFPDSEYAHLAKGEL